MEKPLLLLIDDNVLLTRLYQTAFEKEGYSVVVAHDGETGLALAKEKKPGGILLDLLMPGTDGFAVLEGLKKDSSTKEINTIVLTTVSKPEELERAKKLGALECIIKSEIRLDDLIAHVKSHF